LVEAFSQEYDVPPSGYAAYQYVALRVYADAVNKAGSTEPDAVAQALEGMEFDYGIGKSFIRACDHQVFQPAHIAVGRSETEAKDIQPWPQYAFRKILHSVEPDEKYERTCEELNG